MNTRHKSCGRSILLAFLALGGLCLVLLAVSAISNRGLPTQSTVVDRLSDLDKARVAEVFHLRQTLGDQVMPGWAAADIPVILYNEEYLFLVGLQDPADGWRKVSRNQQMGVAWEPVPGDDFFGQTYYRQKMLAPGQNSQAFTVQVGDHWAASLNTYEWMHIEMVTMLRQDLPAPFQAVFPFSLVANIFIPGSDFWGSAVLHEAIHAYQGIRAPQRLVEGEAASNKFEKQYPWDEASLQEAWQVELDLLNRAMKASTREETLPLAQDFLAQRDARRLNLGLSPDLVDYERQREWVEGIAKYGERMIFLLGKTADYQPVPQVLDDPDFKDYRGAQTKWNQEIDQIRRMAADVGDGRFYYSGFAQAVLLDRLSPGWKDRLFDPDVWLEDLLEEAVNQYQ